MRQNFSSSPAAIEPLESRVLLANGRGLTGYYFDGTDFTARTLIREDSTINFDWNTGSPDPSIGSDGFGVHWAGRVTPKFSEQYRFYTRSTGGVRLWVNNQLIIDDRSTHPLKDNKGVINLKADTRYEIRLEYFDTGGPSSLQLQWASARQARENVPASRMFAAAVDTTPPGTPKHYRATYVTDTAIKMMWDLVAASDPAETIVYGIYLGQKKLGSTTNTSYTRAGRNPSTSYAMSTRAYDFAGNFAATPSVLVTTPPAYAGAGGIGLAGTYFAGVNLDDFRLTRTDPTIEFDWDTAPYDSTSLSPFSARWEGKTVPKYDELYTFYVSATGGTRLWVNGSLLIDQWADLPLTEHRASIKLSAGRQYVLKLEYCNSGGSAETTLCWSSLSQAKQVIPASQLFPAYVDTTPPMTPTGFSLLNETDSSITLGWLPASDNLGVVEYNLYRNSTLIATTPDTQFTDLGLAADTQYQYTLAAVDGVPLVSEPTAPLLVTTNLPPIRNPFTTIDALSFNGAANITTGAGGISSLDDGDWVKYSRFDFSAGGIQSWKVSLGVPANNAGGSIELRLDSTSGPIIGKLVVQPTGSYPTHFSQQVSVSSVSGIHDLYMVFHDRSNIAQIESFRFSTQRLVRIMTLGDSITEGNSSINSYRYYLWQRLVNAGYGVDFVGSRTGTAGGNVPNFNFDQNHEGHSGLRADELLPSVAGWIAAAQPEFVLLHVGTNDIWEGQSAQSTIDDIGHIIDAIRSVNPNIKILLAQLIPLAGFEDEIDELNDLIPSLAASKSTAASPIVVVDQNSGFSLTWDSYDGVHANNNGAHEMGDVWFDALATLLA